jgi:ribosomal-protein-alanine N-acetyltransferase
MYRTFGFRPAGIRKGYYVETNEDALVMWADDIDATEYLERLLRIESGIRGATTVDRIRP